MSNQDGPIVLGTIALYYDIDDYPVHFGAIVSLTEYWEHLPNYDRTYQVMAIDDESGELGLAEITDTSGNWVDWRPNLAIPLQWEWNYRKYAVI